MDKHIKYLISEVFEKAIETSGEISINGYCNYLESTFRDDLKCYEGTSSKSFLRLYKKYVLGTEPENADPKPKLLTVMSQYLGFKDYEDFILHNKQEFYDTIDPPPIPGKDSKTKNPERIIIIVLGLLISGMLLYTIIIDGETPPECMIWEKTHFKKISCELDKNPDKAGKIKQFDVKLFKDMKMIPKNAVQVGYSYYHKENRDSIEFFSRSGKHPVNGDDLKPVTDYIYNKYVIE